MPDAGASTRSIAQRDLLAVHGAVGAAVLATALGRAGAGSRAASRDREGEGASKREPPTPPRSHGVHVPFLQGLEERDQITDLLGHQATLAANVDQLGHFVGCGEVRIEFCPRR